LRLYLFVGTDSSSRATLWDNKMKEFGTEAAGTHIFICTSLLVPIAVAEQLFGTTR
jgi:hypothetical protein